MDPGYAASVGGNILSVMVAAWAFVSRQKLGVGIVEREALKGQRELIKVRDEQLAERDERIEQLELTVAALTTTTDVLVDLLVTKRLATREEILAKVEEATKVTAIRQEVKSRVENMVEQRLEDKRA